MRACEREREREIAGVSVPFTLWLRVDSDLKRNQDIFPDSTAERKQKRRKFASKSLR